MITIDFHDDQIPEFYLMVSKWCEEHSNTFHFIKTAIETRYPKVAERDKTEQ